MSKRTYRIPLRLEPQPEGGFTVTSPVLPELITEGDTVEEALENVRDAFAAVTELYAEDGRQLPEELLASTSGPISTEQLIERVLLAKPSQTMIWSMTVIARRARLATYLLH